MSGFPLNPSRAWWLGAVLTDGWISTHGYMRRVNLKVIDRDFAEAFADACEDLVGTRYSVIPRPPPSPRSKPQWLVQATNKRLYDWVLEETEAKTKVPTRIFDEPREIQRHFLAGVLDGDGWVTIAPQRATRKDGSRGFYVQVGIASTSPWLHELKRLTDMMELPSKGPRLIKRNNPNWAPIYRLLYSTDPIIRERVPLRIVRKRERLEGLWRDLKSSEAICLDPGNSQGKRWSEPVGDYGS